MKTYSATLSALLFTLALLIPAITSAQQGVSDGQWHVYGGDKANTKYTPLDQINRDNVADLKVVWQWESITSDVTALPDNRVRPQEFKATPLMVDGVLYTSTSFSQVAAVDAGTGETIWKYDPKSWAAGRPANIGFIHRGVTYWTDGKEKRIFLPTGHSKLIALDADTGELVSDFADGGMIDLRQGLNKVPRISEHQVNSPPVICNDVIVVGSVIFDRPSTKEYVRGDVRGFDARTGKQLWTFHSIPQAGEFGNDTWEEDSWKYTGGTNVWTVMSADEDLGYVYLPFGAATNDFYGGHRPGDNLYATSLVCLDAKTGKRVWHFQTVHHDLWDYDLPCAPNLIDIVVDGKPIKAVVQFSKTGWCYTFDRVTGEPVWPINEVPVPQSTLPGEKTSPTQPMPTKPAPFAHQGVTAETIIDFSPEIKAEAMKIVEANGGFTPMFTPPTEKGVLMVPGDGGGANYMGAAWDPESSLIYVPSISYVRKLALIKPDPNRSNMDYQVSLGMVGGPSGLSLLKPPYSRMTAINMNTGEHEWMIPVGKGIENRPALKELGIAPTGGGGWAFPLATKTLLLGAQGNSIYAWDKATGDLIATVELRGEGGRTIGRVTGGPSTFMHNGKQHIVTAVTGAGGKGYLVALTLP